MAKGTPQKMESVGLQIGMHSAPDPLPSMIPARVQVTIGQFGGPSPSDSVVRERIEPDSLRVAPSGIGGKTPQIEKSVEGFNKAISGSRDRRELDEVLDRMKNSEELREFAQKQNEARAAELTKKHTSTISRLLDTVKTPEDLQLIFRLCGIADESLSTGVKAGLPQIPKKYGRRS